MSDRLWTQATRRAREKRNLNPAQFGYGDRQPDSFFSQSTAAADSLDLEAENIEAEIFGATARPRNTHAVEAEGMRELSRSIDTWATDAEMSPILNSGYRRWN